LASSNERRWLSEKVRQYGDSRKCWLPQFFYLPEDLQIGRGYRFSVRYFDWYAAEIAWREDNRHVDNGMLLLGMVHFAMSRKTSRNLCGY
jgi:hypothetical protein